MEEAVLLDATPVAAVERIRACEVERPGYGPPVALDRHQHHRIGHPLAEQAEEGAGEIGHPPLAAAGRLVEGVEGVPVALLDLVSRERPDREAGVRDRLPFPANLLALARGEGREEVVEAAVALVEPVELDAGALQQPGVPHQGELGLGGEGDVQRADPRLVAEPHAGGEERRPHRVGLRPRRRQQARPGHRREGDRDLELGVVAPAGALERIRPAVVEDIFAVGVVLEIHRHGAENGAVPALEDDVARVPAGLRRARAAVFERRQEGVADEGVAVAGAAVPRRRVHLGDRAQDMSFDRRVRRAGLAVLRRAPLAAGGHGHCILAPEAARSRRSVLRWISAGPSTASAWLRAGAKASVVSTVQASAPQARAAAAKSGLCRATP